jgi:phosphoribosylglycinamide formyltransferase-1
MAATDSPTTWMVFNALDRAVGVDHVVIEDQVSARALIAARARRLGRLSAAGQVAFRLMVQPLVERHSRRRSKEIVERAGLDSAPPEGGRVTRVPSINDPGAIEVLRKLEPQVVVVAGTRIVSGAVLDAVAAPFLNMHAGITPRYRGVHGGYWARACGDEEHCGVTVHLVDRGVDTGAVIAQARIEPSRRDNFATYPLLQLTEGLPLLVEAVRAALEDRVVQVPAAGPSRQWYHPTMWGYLWTWIRRGVR